MPFLFNNVYRDKKVKSRITNAIKIYGKCPKISNTKVSDKMTYANSADPDQTAPEGAVWSGSPLFAIPLSILRNSCMKTWLGQNSVE